MTIDYPTIARERRKSALSALKLRKLQAFGTQMTDLSLRAAEQSMFSQPRFSSCRSLPC